jgi:hypothetical protein
MTESMTSTRLARLAVCVALSLLALTAAATGARAASSCGIVTAAGHTWIVVTKGVPCSTATRVTRALAARTAAVRSGQKVTVRSPLGGFTCVLASRGKPAGSCATAGAAKSIVWIAAG